MDPVPRTLETAVQDDKKEIATAMILKQVQDRRRELKSIKDEIASLRSQ